MNKQKKKRKPSITREDMVAMSRNGEMCPFGRNAAVLSVRCHNCIFNYLEDDCCYGTKEMAKSHMRRLGLDY